MPEQRLWQSGEGLEKESRGDFEDGCDQYLCPTGYFWSFVCDISHKVPCCPSLINHFTKSMTEARQEN